MQRSFTRHNPSVCETFEIWRLPGHVSVRTGPKRCPKECPRGVPEASLRLPRRRLFSPSRVTPEGGYSHFRGLFQNSEVPGCLQAGTRTKWSFLLFCSIPGYSGLWKEGTLPWYTLPCTPRYTTPPTPPASACTAGGTSVYTARCV